MLTINRQRRPVPGGQHGAGAGSAETDKLGGRIDQRETAPSWILREPFVLVRVGVHLEGFEPQTI